MLPGEGWGFLSFPELRLPIRQREGTLNKSDLSLKTVCQKENLNFVCVFFVPLFSFDPKADQAFQFEGTLLGLRFRNITHFLVEIRLHYALISILSKFKASKSAV